MKRKVPVTACLLLTVAHSRAEEWAANRNVEGLVTPSIIDSLIDDLFDSALVAHNVARAHLENITIGLTRGLPSSNLTSTRHAQANVNSSQRARPKYAMSNFLTDIIDADLKEGGRCSSGTVIKTRFPPEPNGYLHIGHAKSILLNFALAHQYAGTCNLRFDDTNPATEDTEYVKQIMEDVKWLTQPLQLSEELDEATGNILPPWGKRLYYTSDYFEQLFEMAKALIKAGKAYVDSQTPEDVQRSRGGGPEQLPAFESPFRNRSVGENLRLFDEMQDGKHEEGSMLLRAKIDMQSPNVHLRDPPIYRIKNAAHHRTGERWKVYPIYDFAHGQSDSLEKVTHSICTLEFQEHNILYQWFVENIPGLPSRPQQYEFARLNIEGAVTSKRKLLRLVNERKVAGWDDPRLLTICGLRRRGVRPEAIKSFVEEVGVSRMESTLDMNVLDNHILADLKEISLNKFVILNPLKVEITSVPIGSLAESFSVPNHPIRTELGSRNVSFSREIYIERDDYQPEAGADFYRFKKIGDEVKLRHSYAVKLEEVILDERTGQPILLKCSHDPATGHGMPKDRKIKGIIHWVDAKNYLDTKVNLIQRLFTVDTFPNGADFVDFLNPDSLIVMNAKAEASLKAATLCDRFQFERKGYFTLDYNSTTENLVFTRTVALTESAVAKKMQGKHDKSRKEEHDALMAERERLRNIAPKDFFKREYPEKYSKYDDETGLPTHDKLGEPLTKSGMKKLRALQDKHKKLYETWLKETSGEAGSG